MHSVVNYGLAASLAAFLLLPPSSAAADVPAQPTSIVVFGDSLSDTGNAFEATLHTNPPSPPYFEGRFSNGPVWVELFARSFGLEAGPAIRGGTNFAVGGAKTGSGADSLTNQAAAFLAQRGLSSLNPDAVFVVFGGGNDLDDALDSGDPAAVVTGAATNIRDIIEELTARGAVNFLVPNLPNKGLTPAARARGTPAEEQALSIAFNTALGAVLDDLSTRLGVNVVRVNLFDLQQSVVAMPAAFGFSNVSDPCLVEQNGGTVVCGNPDSFLFWDDIHPTARSHAFIASAAIAAYRLAVASPATSDAGTGRPVSFPRSLVDPKRLIDDVKHGIDRIFSRAFQ